MNINWVDEMNILQNIYTHLTVGVALSDPFVLLEFSLMLILAKVRR